MLCQEESQIFQILFIPGIFCHLLGLELLSYPFLSSLPDPMDTAENEGESFILFFQSLFHSAVFLFFIFLFPESYLSYAVGSTVFPVRRFSVLSSQRTGIKTGK